MFNRFLQISVFILVMLGLLGIPAPTARALEGDDVSAAAMQTAIFTLTKRFGGTAPDIGTDIAVDGNGSMYITGTFWGTVSFGNTSLTSAGFEDIFVAKLDSGGNVVWAKRMGGSEYDSSNSIAVDGSGNVYITGLFLGTAAFGATSLTSAGGPDVFIAKLNPNGNFLWAKRMGGNNNDHGYGIAIDESGNVYTTGYYNGTVDFDPGANTFNLTSAGIEDIFVSKLDTNGNFAWAKRVGGGGSDIGYDIAVDGSGSVYITGYFMGTADYNPDAGIYNMTSAGGSDIFVSKLDTNGNFAWATSMGGLLNDIGTAIAVDASGNPHVTGYFMGSAGFGATTLTGAGDNDAFVAKLNSSSGSLAWAKTIGGASGDFGDDIAVDEDNNVYTLGTFSGTADFDPGAGVFNLTSAGGVDVFAVKLNGNGEFSWAKQMGGSKSDHARGISLSGNGIVHAIGAFQETAKFGAHALTSAGTGDVFVTKLIPGSAMTFDSIAAQDGWILESSETSNKGGKLNKGAATLNVGDDAANRQYRAILSFDTASLPPFIAISSVTLQFKYAGKKGMLPFGTHGKLLADIRKEPFSNNPALQLGDFKAKADKNAVLSFGNNKADGWYSQSLQPSDFQYINTNGVTQFRLRFAKDDNNDFGADFLKLYSGNADPANQPQLVIEYTTLVPIIIFP